MARAAPGRALVRRLAAGLMSWALLAAPAAQAHAVRDQQGRTVELARVPQRIVSLLPSATESLCALGACSRLVGVDAFSNFPPEISALPRLGSVSAPQFEAIVRLKPDVVLMSHSPPLMARLAQFGIAVVVLDAQDLAGIRAQWQVLDELLQQRRADALNARLQGELDRVGAAARTRPSRSVYFEVDATPYAAGPQSFIGELLTVLGARNIVAPALGAFPRLTPEYVVRQNPQLIIHTAETNPRDLAQRPGWAATDAVRGGMICSLGRAETDLVSRPGPRLAEAAAVLARCLQLAPR